LLFLMGITTGFRVSDLLMLKVRDVEGTHIKVMEQKTKKMKRVIISPDLKKVLKEYLKDKKANDYLFLSKKRLRVG
ncbi:tyrosine-type recombinase/integrase, partial [Kurthia sp. Dielmo]|uniref:tyrosine-type recombinase/integrase n=1 Tax=Kurthia sp. Dielmo TaxID=1033738 RepID=UPI0011AE56BB